MLHFDSEWWGRQSYKTAISPETRSRRMWWGVVWTLLFRSTPYFMLKKWRVWLLARFGMKGSKWNAIHPTVKIWAPWNVELGHAVAIDDYVNLYSVGKITIGTKVAISREAFICTASHDITTRDFPLTTAPVTIGAGAWIAAHARVMPGITIGEGAVVGAGSVVTKNVEPWTVVAGNPAKFIKKRVIE